MKTVLDAAKWIVGIIPGLAVILSGLGVPPGMKLLFAGVTEAVGILTVLLIWLRQTIIKRWTLKAIFWIVISCFGASLCLVIVYYNLFQHCVVQATNPAFQNMEPVFFPIYLDGAVLDRVNKAGSRLQAVNDYGPGEMSDKITTMPGYEQARFFTQALLLLVYQSFIVTLVMSFCLLLIYFQAHPHLIPKKDKEPK